MSRLSGAPVPPFVAAAIAPVWAGRGGRFTGDWTSHNPINTRLTGPIASRALAWQNIWCVARPDDETATGIVGNERGRQILQRCSMLDVT